VLEQKDLEILSKKNLAKLLDKINKFKEVRDGHDVRLALEALPVYHCVRQGNIIEVLRSGEIKVKNQVVQGEFTNQSTDLFQGFESHLSMSIGKPWVEYGPYAFGYGLEHIDEHSLFFCEDPWLWSADEFQNNFLLKNDFIIYATEMLKRNLRRITSKIYIRVRSKKADLHKLAEKNFKTWEVKQASNLKITDADEFFPWTGIDEFIFKTVKVFTSGTLMVVYLVVGVAIVWVML